jgi:hypothetical protein
MNNNNMNIIYSIINYILMANEKSCYSKNKKYIISKFKLLVHILV